MSDNSGSKTKVVEYFMSSWWAACAGPVDALKSIWINDKRVWSGTLYQSGVVSVHQPELFGGIKKEGGVSGTMAFLNGHSEQRLPEYLANKFGLHSYDCPAHRGIASVFLSGGSSSENPYGVTFESGPFGGMNLAYNDPLGSQGFYQRANFPAAPTIEIEVMRSPKGLAPEISMIGDNANPIHVAFECYTNKVWGAGVPVSAFDVDDLNDIAFSVHQEGIGVSLLWSEQQSVEVFVNTILGYVNAVPFFVHPQTGLLTTKLIRGGYDVASLFEINPDNATLSGFQRKMWAETINEIVVSWTNPETEDEETVSAQDLGNIAMQGAVVSETRDYKGLRRVQDAMYIAKRDLRIAASPLAICQVRLNRAAYSIVPGSVVRLYWPEHGIANLPMRVADVDRGEKSDSAITLTLTEDIFGAFSGDYFVPLGSAWAPNAAEPMNPSASLVTTLPYHMHIWAGANIAAMTSNQVRVGVLAADESSDVRNYVINYEKADANGNTIWVGSETRSMLSRSTLIGDLPFEAPESTIYITNATPGLGVKVGSFVILGGPDATQEVGVVVSIGVPAANSIKIRRGMMDTTPKVWGAGTPVWFIPRGADIMDDVVRAANAPVTYRLRTTTSLGTLSIAHANDLTETLTRRPWLPLRPAGCIVNAQGYGPISAPGATSLSLSWLTRNRLTEDSVLLGWWAPSVTPEPGVTTRIKILSTSGELINSISGLTGTSYTLSTTLFGGVATRDIQFVAVDASGNESLQGHIIRVTI